MVDFVDIIFGLQWGDEGKGKISNALANDYDYVCRWNGGPNAGHTVYVDNIKYKTHIVPCGIFKNKISIIGPNCVLNLDKFYQEIAYLSEAGFDTSLVKVSPKTHIISNDHIKYDLEFLKEKLGTTGQGIAPAYADKMLRSGKLAKDLLDDKYLWDGTLKGKVLCEGAQSFWLDINFGDYPYVTSSETLPYSACSLGFSTRKIRDIIGVAKVYDTKSGVDPLFPPTLWQDEFLGHLITTGEEYGSTTGRKRIANWLRLDKLIKAINMSGVNKLIFNKCDVLEKVGKYKILFDDLGGNFIDFINIEEMVYFIKNQIKSSTEVKEILFSRSKYIV